MEAGKVTDIATHDVHHRLHIGIDCRYASFADALYRGIGRYSRMQLRAVIERDRINQYFLFVLPNVLPEFLQESLLSYENVSLIQLPDVAASFSISDALRVSKLYQEEMKQYKLDVFHTTTPMFAIEHSFIDFNLCPMVATHYDLIPFVFADEYLRDRRFREIYLTTLNLSLRQSERLISISEASRQEAATLLGFDSDRIDVAYPIPDPIFRPLRSETMRKTALSVLKRSNRKAISGNYLMTVSAMHHSKNLETLLKAYAKLPTDFREEYPLALVFDLTSNERERLTAMALTLSIYDNLIVTGHVTDEELLALYNTATIYIHPSRYEGFGIPVVEAMACGTPVITTTAASLPEAAGNAGILLDPDDVNGFTSAIQSLVDDPEKRRILSEHGLRHSQSFTLSRLGESVLNSYVSTAAGSWVRSYSLVPSNVQTREYSKFVQFSANASQQNNEYDSDLDAPVTPEIMSQLVFPTPIHGLFHSRHNDESRYHLRSLFDKLNHFRLRSDTRVLSHIPILGFFFRLAIRLRNIGRVWGANLQLLDAILTEMNALRTQTDHDLDMINGSIAEVQSRNDKIARDIFNALDKQIATTVTQSAEECQQALNVAVQQMYEVLNNKGSELCELITIVRQTSDDAHVQIEQLRTKIHHIENANREQSEISKREIGALFESSESDNIERVSTIDAKLEKYVLESNIRQIALSDSIHMLSTETQDPIKQLIKAINTYDEKLRLLTSHIRMLKFHQHPMVPDDIVPINIEHLLDFVRGELTELFAVENNYVSVQASNADDLFFQLADYFGMKVSPLELSQAWYHVHFSPLTHLINVIQNASVSLMKGQYLIIISDKPVQDVGSSLDLLLDLIYPESGTNEIYIRAWRKNM